MKFKRLIPSILFVCFLTRLLCFQAPGLLCQAERRMGLYDVWGSSGSDVFAVGNQGGGDIILHYDGSAWSSMLSGTTYGLLGVWGSSGSDVFVVGSYFDLDLFKYYVTILHYNGSTWSSMTTPLRATTYILRHVWGSSGTDVFAVGADWDGSRYNGGTILHYNGSTWSSMESGTTKQLSGVWGSSGSDVFAVGSYGTILHYAEAATLIELTSFTAIPSNREVIITWPTESEIDNAGFNLYRSESENGEFTKINSSLIPAQRFTHSRCSL